MNVEVQCLTCKKPVDKVFVERNVYRRSYEVDAWCHGKREELEITHLDALNNPGPFRLEAFRPPTIINVVIDRDLGDEDPNEPWERQKCQF